MSDTLLQAATEVARLAGDLALGHYRSTLAVERKQDGSPVTIADRAAEQAARSWIQARFPADAVLGEEYGETNAGARRRWILDPIDGTKSFVRGVPLWGTLVAVCERETVLAGAAYFPAVNEIVSGAPGEGSWHNGSRCSVSRVSSLADATALTTDERFSESPQYLDGWRALSSRVAVSRSWGDCFGYLLLVTGRAEIMTDGVMNPWDAAALQPIVTEAGGVFTDWGGRETAFGGSVIATNAALAVEARQLLSSATS